VSRPANRRIGHEKSWCWYVRAENGETIARSAGVHASGQEALSSCIAACVIVRETTAESGVRQTKSGQWCAYVESPRGQNVCYSEEYSDRSYAERVAGDLLATLRVGEIDEPIR
jgi:uncharacterized protein YegP (UPF0339 family)